MTYGELVEALRKIGAQVLDRQAPADSLGLSDVARARLLTELGGLLRVYHAETPGGLPSVPRLRSKLQGTGYDELVLATRDGEEFLAVRVDAQGDEVHKTLSAAETVGLLKNAGLEDESDPAAVSDRVLELLTREVEPKAYDNRGLFSDDYLEHRVPESDEWTSDVSAAWEGFKKLYADKKDSLAGMDEANTEMEFLEPALALLGFHPIKQAKTKAGSKPDYALFGSAEDKGAASKLEKGSEAFYARTLAVVEGKYWGRNLDVYTKKEDKRESEKQTSSPEMQLVRYLRETEVPWGLLTNGAEWRLYRGDAVGKAKNYCSVDFERALQSEDDFRRFFLFFRREAFAPKGPESKSFLDGVLDGSERYAIRVGNNLKDVIFTRVFPQLARGFLENHTGEQGLTVDEEVLGKIYRGTLALLYRLLFLLYAESRDLLPTGDPLGYGARGINAIKAQVAERLDNGYTYTGGYVLWQSLADLFHVVDEGDQALKVPPYNGGLFRNDGNHELLATHRISDDHLASALDALSRQRDEDDENRFVDYGYVGVRELGSVYEGLLEFSLKIADEDFVAVKEKGKEVYVKAGTQGRKTVVGRVSKGQPYLVNDKKERKATGSYYTPRYIVDYIVENTLGPLVEERRAALEVTLEEVRRTDDSLRRSRKSEEYRAERRRDAGALETLLDVKVLDPAMGSGHFLVAAVDYLTDEFSRLISELDAQPIIEQLAHLRDEIEESLEKYGTKASEEQLSDANLLKRMILKRCVYGVDQNEMAVELAKLSLWLDAFTVGAPLSFLDHHLKHGNSLIGSSVQAVRDEVEKAGSLFGNQFTATLLQGTELMQHVGEIPDATAGQVKDSFVSYGEAERVLGRNKRMLDIWTSQHFGNKRAQDFLSDTVTSGAVDHLTRGDYDYFAGEHRKIIDTATSLAENKSFFHWELEFPDVFYEGTREHEDPGFDAVVGNPPYDVLKRTGENASLNEFIDYARSAPMYEPAISRMLNIFHLVLVRASRLLSRRSTVSMIVPMALLSDQSAKGVREFLIENHRLGEIQAFPQKDDEHNRVFPEAKLSTIVLAARKGSSTETLSCRVHPGKDIAPDSPVLNLNVADIRDFDPENITVPLGNPDEVTILQRMFSADVIDPLSSIAKVAVGEIDMTQDRDCKQTEPGDYELLKGAHLQRYFKRPYPKQGQREWITIAALKRKYGTDSPKVGLARSPRLAFQGVTGTDDSRRMKAALTPRGYYLANSLNYFKVHSAGIDVQYVLALFNSQMLEWRFRLTSTNNNVNNYEVNSLPVRRITFVTPQLVREQELATVKTCYEAKHYADILSWAERELSWTPNGEPPLNGRTDIVHDSLAYIAGQVTTSVAKREEIKRVWQEWVETAIPQADNLTKTFRKGGWVEIGLREGWDGIKSVFQTRNAVPPSGTLQDLRRETEDALSKLRPLYERIEATDRLIDQIVYRLYGLTEEEIAVVEKSVKGA